jgi:hypothetical protein
MSYDDFGDSHQDSHQGANRQQSGSKDNSTIKILLIILVVLFGGGVLVCGGIGFFLMRAVDKFEQEIADIDWDEILNSDSEVLADMIRESEEVKSAVGDVQSVTTDYEKTDQETEADDEFVWHKVVGSGGEGWLITEDDLEGDKSYKPEAELVKPDGTRVKIQLADLPYDADDTREVYMKLKDDPRVTQVIGAITQVELDWERTDAETSDEDPYFWYSVVGEQGQAFALTDEADEIVIQKVELPGKSTFVP